MRAALYDTHPPTLDLVQLCEHGQSLQAAFAAQPQSAAAPYERHFSFGIVSAPKGHGTLSINTLLQQADSAMYEQKRLHKAKEAGR